MPPVLFFNAPRDCYRDVIVSPDELYITREPVGERQRCLQRPPGRYDVSAMLKDLPEEYREPSMVMCQWDCVGMCEPFNLKGVAGKKVLLVGDTHHTRQPLTRSIRLALAEPWDLVVLEFNPQHLHWFRDAGIRNVACIPCFTISPIDIPPPEKRTRGITFVGSIGPDHKYRRYVLDELKRRGLDVEVISGVTRQEAAKIYNESLATLNIPLNGDFNLRNYEAPAAGGYLIAGGIDEMERLIRDVTEVKSLEYAKERYALYWNQDSPEQKVRMLNRIMGITWLAVEPMRPSFFGRLNLYEQIQELVCQGHLDVTDLLELPRWRNP